MKVTYIGHATLLLELGGARILTDPNFDSKLGRILPRVSAPGIALDKLPALDAILLTHAHADHLSFDSIDRLPRTIPLFAPPVVAKWLRRLGYSHAVDFAPGESAQVGDVTIRAASATHRGNRYGYDRWRSSANMYLLDAGERNRLNEETSLGEAIARAVVELAREEIRPSGAIRKRRLQKDEIVALAGSEQRLPGVADPDLHLRVAFLQRDADPERVPPVPTEHTNPSTRPSVCAQISGPVVS